MEIEYDKTTDVTKVKLTRDEIREILCGEPVEQYTNVGGVFKIERIDDADAISSIAGKFNTDYDYFKSLWDKHDRQTQRPRTLSI